jgi:L-lactate dehydrogenase (cytochrome)
MVVTVDVARPGPRERDRRNGFIVPPRVTARTLVDGVRRPRWTANFLSRPRILSESLLSSVAREGQAGSMAELIGRQFDPALSWRDIAWVQEHWDGPLLIKGILRGDDARQAASLGLAGVIVSNHGGRQLDHATSTIRALPEIVDAVGSELEVYMDGGIRRGVDLIRALALGARACLAGRALVYGLAAGGPAGAQRAVEILVDELRLAMTLLGCPSVRELDASWVTAARAEDRSAWST